MRAFGVTKYTRAFGLTKYTRAFGTTAFLGWVLLLAPMTGLAGVYTWVDEQGRKHYSDRPPPGAKASAVELKPPANRDPGAAAAGSDPNRGARAQKRNRLLRAFELERQRRKQLAAEAQAKRAAAREACARERERLQEMHDARALVRTAPDGSRIYLSDAERADAVARVEHRVSALCS
ncbi:MAG: DUF4124 domain-containing protein [Gammaproteobacteria bacterium]